MKTYYDELIESGKPVLYRYTHKERVKCAFGIVHVEGILILEAYEIIKETPQGYWIDRYFTNEASKWVSNNGKSIYARKTKAEALNDFIIRKQKQLAYINNNVICIKDALKQAENLNSNETNKKDI